MAASNSNSEPTQSQLAEAFMAMFNQQREEIGEGITNLQPVSNASSLNDQLTEIAAKIQTLSKSLHDASIFLPSYSVKIRQSEIRELEKSLNDKESTLIPKKRFGFKSKLPPPSSDVNKISDSDTSGGTISNSILKSADNYFTIENMKSQTLVYGESQLNGNDVLVKDSEDSTITLEGGPSTLRLVNLKNCRLLCGPVHTSVFVDNVHDSVLFLCCQQLRTHSSENVDIYLKVRSRAIIEDCRKIRFGPYQWNHEKSKELHSKSEIDESLERFDAVDDFNWLSSTPSPNWSLIPSSEWVRSNVAE